MIDRTRQQAVFKSWYDRNRQAFNDKRRKRYRQDPEARLIAQQSAAAYRTRPRGDEEPERREGLWTTTGVAYQLGISAQTLRNWEARGLIPVASYGVKHRLYSTGQVELLALFHYCVSSKDPACDAVIAQVFDQWATA